MFISSPILGDGPSSSISTAERGFLQVGTFPHEAGSLGCAGSPPFLGAGCCCRVRQGSGLEPSLPTHASPFLCFCMERSFSLALLRNVWGGTGPPADSVPADTGLCTRSPGESLRLCQPWFRESCPRTCRRRHRPTLWAGTAGCRCRGEHRWPQLKRWPLPVAMQRVLEAPLLLLPVPGEATPRTGSGGDWLGPVWGGPGAARVDGASDIYNCPSRAPRRTALLLACSHPTTFLLVGRGGWARGTSAKLFTSVQTRSTSRSQSYYFLVMLRGPSRPHPGSP